MTLFDALNLQRRHRTASQAAAIAVEALGLYEAEAKERQGTRGDIGELIPQGETGKARDHAGAAVGVSGRYVEHAAKAFGPNCHGKVRAILPEAIGGKASDRAASDHSEPLSQTI